MKVSKTSNLQQLCYSLVQKEASAGAAEVQCGGVQSAKGEDMCKCKKEPLACWLEAHTLTPPHM